jgi:hypothetical protein
MRCEDCSKAVADIFTTALIRDDWAVLIVPRDVVEICLEALDESTTPSHPHEHPPAVRTAEDIEPLVMEWLKTKLPSWLALPLLGYLERTK